MAEKLIKYITIDDLNLLIKHEKRKDYKLLYALCFGSGLRISEVLGYKVKKAWKIKPLIKDQIDIKTHQIRVIGGKGQKDRITITSPWLNESNINMLPLNIERRTAQYHFKKHALKILNKNMSLHTLRHGFGNHMVNIKKVPLPYVQVLMGHARVDTTGVYTKANPIDAVKSAFESF